MLFKQRLRGFLFLDTHATPSARRQRIVGATRDGGGGLAIVVTLCQSAGRHSFSLKHSNVLVGPSFGGPEFAILGGSQVCGCALATLVVDRDRRTGSG